MPARFLLGAVFLLSFAPSASADVERFFFSGDGRLQLHHAHFARDLDVRFRDESGRYDHAALATLREFFRSRTDDAEGPLSLRLVELLDFVEDRFRPRRLVLYSAYRSPDFNAALPGAARASLHTQGLAADVGLEGVDLVDAWKQMRRLDAGGMGYYAGDGFLHVDTGKPRFWEQSTSRVGENLSADNARVFARTEFDRYARLDDVRVTIHGVTALPLGLRAELRPGATLQAESDTMSTDDGCVWIREFADEYAVRLRVEHPAARSLTAAGSPLRFELATCAPSAGQTPATIATNRIEWVAPPAE